MAAKPVEVTVGERTFMVQPLSPFEALYAFGDLQKELLPAVAELMGAAAGTGPKEEGAPEGMDFDSIKTSLQKLSSQLDGKQIEYWSNRLLTKDHISVEVEGRMVPLDKLQRESAFEEFTDILELLIKVIEINFAGPLMGFLSRFGLDKALPKAVK